ncbi:MAG: response regulator [Candidatus Rokubacteria bacterium]|nr:response regulator [Candidatus Rokubacteria bacterium]
MAKRFLIIDDDSRVSEALGDYLTLKGHVVETAADGASGLVAVINRRPDLVFLDINMPGINGLRVLKQIRRVDANIPVVMITGNSDAVVAGETLRSGAIAYLPKPFEFRYVDHLVAAALTQPDTR